MRTFNKSIIITLLASIIGVASCRLLQKQNTVSAAPTPVKEYTPEPSPVLAPVANVNTFSPYRTNPNFKLFRDSINAFWGGMKATQDGIAIKQDIMLSKMDTAMSRQLVNGQNINNLLYVLSEQNVEIKSLKTTVSALTTKSTVSQETKRQALFSETLVSTAVLLNFAFVVFIAIIVILILIFTLKNRNLIHVQTNLKTEPK